MEYESTASGMEEESTDELGSIDPGESLMKGAEPEDASGITGQPHVKQSDGEQSEAEQPVELLMRLASSVQFFRGLTGGFMLACLSSTSTRLSGSSRLRFVTGFLMLM
jgi:hypothetical protein